MIVRYDITDCYRLLCCAMLCSANLLYHHQYVLHIYHHHPHPFIFESHTTCNAIGISKLQITNHKSMVKKPHKISNPDSINRNNRIFFEASRESRLLRALSLSISSRNPPPYNVHFHAGTIAVDRISFRKQIINLISFHPSNSVVKTVPLSIIIFVTSVTSHSSTMVVRIC